MAWHDITCNTHVAWSKQSGGTVKSHDTNMGEWCQWYKNQCTYKSEVLITVQNLYMLPGGFWISVIAIQ